MADDRDPFFGRDQRSATGNEVGLFIPVAEVFPGTTADERILVGLLDTLSRDDTLFHAARLNIIMSGPGDYDMRPRQEQAMQMLCTREQFDRINAFARSHKAAGLPSVFFRGQLLELMRWTARHAKNLPGDGKTFNDPNFRERLVKAALIAGELWGQRIYGGKLISSSPVADARLRALGALRKGVEETNLAPHIGVAIGRGLKLFTDYVPRYLPNFFDVFEAATGLTLRQYLGCATALLTYILQRSGTGPMFVSQTVAAATTYKDIFPKFFALESQSPEELGKTFWNDFENVGYKALRERSIMLAADGRGMVLDPTFFIERVSIGPLFLAVKGKSRQESNRIFGAFGDAFEDYVNEMLERMYPRVPGLVDRVLIGMDGYDAQSREFEIDAAVLNVGKAVVFETKASFLREDAVTSDDPQDFVRAIRASYGSAADGKERDKGVAQLARSIGAIVRGEWKGQQDEFDGLSVIYPVLVAHDTRLDAPALGNFLEGEMRGLLGTVPSGKRVAPLTVMTIQDLENLEKSINDFSLTGLLEDYSRECPDRMRSLHNFIAFSAYAPKIKPSDFLIDASKDILDVLIKELFPGAKLPWDQQTD
jgi:hypothetical protein